jgi:hypothetical protein
VKLADVTALTPVAVKRSVTAPKPSTCKSVKVATPLTAFTVAVPAMVPLPVKITAVTASVLVVRLPFASRISTTGCVVSATPLTDPPGCVPMVSCDAAPAVPVAVKVTGLPLSPATDAATVFAPAVVPSVQPVRVARPAASVTTVAGLAGVIEPPPLVTVNVTLTPLTGALPASVTFTLGAAVTAVPAVADCVNAEFAAMVVGPPPVTVKLDEVADVRPAEVKVSVNVPVPVIARSLNDAVPLLALTDVVPLNVPTPLATAALIGALLVVMLPVASRTSMTGCVVSGKLLTPFDGCVTTTSCVGAPATTWKTADVALVNPAAANEIACAPSPSTCTLVNVATPLTAVAVSVPVSVPLPLKSDAVTTVLLVVRLPNASRISTTGCVVSALPLTAPEGCVVMMTSAAGPTIPVALNNTGLPVKPTAVAVSVLAPAVAPSVHDVSVATPNALVATVAGLAGLVAPPPDVTANTTFTPATGLPPASVTFTLGGAATAVPAFAVCGVAEFDAMVVGGPAATDSAAEFTDSDGVLVANCSVCGPNPVIASVVKVVTPLTAASETVPLSVPLPLLIVAAIESVAPGPSGDHQAPRCRERARPAAW